MRRWLRPITRAWVLAVLLLCRPAFGQVLEISGKITFQANRDGNGEVYSMNNDGSSQTRLTIDAGDDHYGHYSPDGSRIVFRSNRTGNNEIFVMRADGTGVTNLTNNAAHDESPVWSPDGSKIAFNSVRDHANGEIYVMNADGSNVTRLTNNAFIDAAPWWSPDGSKIAFKTNRDGNMEIYSMNADGSNQTNLTNNAAGDYDPSWSPDGTKIGFYSNRDGNDEAYVMNADGSGQTNLSSNGNAEGAPVWSPDGTRLAFGSNRDGNWEIYSAGAGGGGVTRLINDGAQDGLAGWEGGFRHLGDAGVGATVSRTMTIKNTGGSTLSVTNISSSDGQFTISPTSFSVAAGNTQNVTLTFAPTSTGVKYATLTISSNATNGASIALIANGTAVQFTEQGIYAGVNNTATAHGAAWADYDNDGDQDLYLTIDSAANKLYRNDNNGTFAEVAASAGVALNSNSRVPLWGDYDNDGDLDLFVAVYAGQDKLYRNNGNSTFYDITASAGFTGDTANGKGATWIDVDADGDLELYVANDGQANTLYWNNGNSTFIEVGGSAGLGDNGNGWGVAAADYDNDGDQDIYLANNGGANPNRLYRNNNNDGTFTEVGASAGVNASGTYVGASWGDYDNDGDQDLYAASSSGTSVLYRNNGNGTFSDVNSPAGLGGYSGYGAGWVDYDSDGDLDLYASRYGVATTVYRNNGNSTFTEVAASLGIPDAGNVAAATWGDYDNDGDVDLFAVHESGQASLLYRNNGNGNRWLTVQLKGTKSNTASVGAKLAVTAAGVTQTRQLDGGSGYQSQPSLPMEFGFGATSTLSQVTATWPSGLTRTQSSVATNQVLTLTEPRVTISSISPTSANVGASVTINGADFDGTPANNTVYFGATKATVTAASATSLTATVPAGATLGPVSVQVGKLTGVSKQYFLPTFAGTGAPIDAPSLGVKVDFGAGTNTRGIAFGDLDGDGKADLAVTNSGSSNVSVFRNTSSAGDFSSGSFAARADFATGTTPYDVAIGDLDWDGKPDLVVVNYGSNTVSVFRNTSTPGSVSFASRVDFATGTAPFGVAVDDLDGDGRLDLAVTSFNGGAGALVSVLRNTAVSGVIDTYSFAAKVDFTTGAGPGAVRSGDLDGDGKSDLAVANYTAGTVSVLRNTSSPGTIASGSFAAKVDFTAGTNPGLMALADLDGDGKLDMAVANQNSNNVSVFHNTSSSGSISGGSFAAKVDFTTGTTPFGLAVGDLDGDGKPDLALANAAGNTVSLLRNTSSSGSISGGSFAAKVDFATDTYPMDVAFGDLDGDGKADLVTANSTGNSVSVLRNLTPIPTITSFTPTAASSGASVTITGTNFSTTNGNNRVFFGTAKATVTAATATTLTATVPTGATFGPIRVTVAKQTATSRQMFLPTFTSTVPGVDDATLAPKVDFATGATPMGTTLGDIDGDGKPDVVVASYGSNVVSVYRNTSTTGAIDAGSLAARVDFATGGDDRSVALGDLDGDGKLDLVAANHGSNTVSVLRNTSVSGTIDASSFDPKVDFATGSQPWHVAIGDLDGDGRLDLAVVNEASNSVSILRNTGTPGAINSASFAPKVDFTTGSGPLRLAIGDLDGDGKADLAVANWGSGGGSTVSVLRNTSAPGTITASSFAAKVDYTTGTGPLHPEIGDIDGDGKLDLVVGDFNGNTVSLLRNTSTPGTIDNSSFAAKVDFATGTGPYGVAIGDVDGDGKADLAIPNFGANTVSVFRNTSSSGTIDNSSLAARVDFAAGSNPEYAAFGDVDGDGRPELLVANNGANTVSVLRNKTLTTPLPTITSFTPSSANVGASVTITGTNFSATTGNNTVYFGGVQATVSAASTTSLTATVPAGASFGPLRVKVANRTATSKQVFFPTFAATVREIVPATFAAHADFAASTAPRAIATGDLDGDGKPDVAVANYTSGTVSVYLNTGTSGSVSFAAKVDLAAGSSPVDVEVADLDGDGLADLVVPASGAAQVSVFRNTSTTGSLSFATRADFTAGSGAQAVAVADLDGDGRPELAVANLGANTVSVLRNSCSPGTIAFAAKVDFATGNGPGSVAAGDMDGDGKMDLAVANSGAGTVSVFRNTATAGAFTSSSLAAKVDFGTANQTADGEVVIGDVDGDGGLDLAVSCFTDDLVSVLRNTSSVGSVSFATKVDFATANGPTGLALGDVDGDGRADLAVAVDIDWSVSLLRNQGSSGAIDGNTFAPRVSYTVGQNPFGVAVVDLDGDGRPEVAAANFNTADFSVLRNLTYTSPLLTITSISPTSASVGASVTINGNQFSTTMANNTVYFGATKATLTGASTNALTATVPVGATFGPVSVTVADRTAIAKQFFLPTFAPGVANPGIGTNTLGFKLDLAANTEPYNVAIGDLDGDGKADLAVANYGAGSGNTVSVYRNTGSSGSLSFATKVDFTTGTGPRGVVLGDLDGDGKQELITTNYAANTISVFRNTSTSGAINGSSFAAKVDFATGNSPYNAAIGDVDGDRKPDLAVSNYASASVSFFRNTSPSGTINASSFAAKQDFATGTNPVGLSFGDLEGDGKPDLAVVVEAANVVSVFRNTANPGAIDGASFAAKVDFAAGTSPQYVAIGDVDGDGKLDLATANYSAGSGNTVSLFRNTSTTGVIDGSSFATKVDFTTGTGPLGVALGDLDGDGKPDLGVASSGVGSVSIFKNVANSGSINGGSLVPRMDFATGSGPLAVAFGDLDGDSKTDLVVSNKTAGTLSVLRNLEPKLIEVGAAAGVNDGGTTRGVSWVDIDADGDLDLYITNSGGTSRLYRNNNDGSFAEIGGSAGVQNSGLAAHGSSWADYDNDGDFDLYQVISGVANRLYRNNGDQTFTDIAGGAGVQGAAGATDYNAAWADYDRDGQVDLYLGGTGSALYRNNGDGTFTDQTTAAGVGNGALFATGLAWADYDNDGDPDLYLGFTTGNADRLLRNNGDGTFTDVASAAGMGVAGNRTGAAWADYDNDGDLDLYQVFSGGANRLYRNNGNSTFAEVAAAAGVNYAGAGQGVAWQDWDNDGDLDLYVSDHNNEADQKYQNNGDGTFTEVGGQLGLIDSDSGTGLSWGDYDQNGAPDLYLAIDGTNRLYRNQGSQHHWLEIKLIGSESSRDAIGTRVMAVTGATRRRREVDGGSGYFSQPSLPVEFGLGAAGTVDSLIIAWPTGNVNVYLNVVADGVLTKTELARPALVSPPSASTGQPTRPSFSWNGVAGATLYHLQVATDAGFTNVVFDDPNVAGTSASPNNDLQGLTTYYWRVRAKNASTASSFGPSRSFTTGFFSEEGGAAGISSTGNWVGGAWGDIEGDHLLDLVLLRDGAPLLLYRNNGNGSFADASSALKSNGSGTFRGAVWGDYDNDARSDLFVAANGSANRLYHNDDDQNLSNLAGAAGVGRNGAAAAAGWADYDNDGNLDLFVGYSNEANSLYHNDGDATFTDEAASAGVNSNAPVTGAAWADYNGDGEPDLYLTHYQAANRLYKNNGGGSFVESAAFAGVDHNGGDFAPAWGDYDNDGDLDLFVAQGNVTYTSTSSLGNHQLFRNNDNGTFTEVGNAAGVADTRNGRNAVWGDYDNDGKLDLFVANTGGNDRLYHNNGNGTFSDLAPSCGIDDPGHGHGAAWGDYDLDGRLDLYVADFGQNNRLFHNTGNNNHWLKVELLGTGDNTSGIGAEVTVVTSGGRQRRDLEGGSGYVSQSAQVAHFGLGSAVAADSVIVRWPNGVWQYSTNVAADQQDLIVVQPPRPLVPVAADSGVSVPVDLVWSAAPSATAYHLQVSTNPSFAGLAFNDSTLTSTSHTLGGLSPMTTYYWRLRFKSPHGASGFTAPQPFTTAIFNEVGASAGVDDNADGEGAAWGDYDNDGDQDLYVVNFDAPNRLYRNNGGTFAEVGSAAGVADAGVGDGAAWGDYDNDGDLDLYLANNGANRLYRNGGSGSFAEVGASAQVNDTGYGQGVSWADYDRDGDLDLYLVNHGSANRLYRNDGSNFAEVGASAGVADTGTGYAGVWGDYDNDGDPDLYLTNNGTNRLFQNNNGTFVDKAANAGVANSAHGTGAAWGDYDNDGDQDLYVANFGDGTNLLYRNNGNSTFTDVAASAGVDVAASGYGVAWGDYDNDGRLDLYVGDYGGTKHLFRNNGNQTFGDLAGAAGVDNWNYGVGAAWADYDNDGALDLYVVDHGANELYHNTGNNNRWLQVKLAASTNANNRFGVGARVTATAGGISQRRDAEGGSGFLSQASPPLEFGFGTNTTVSQLTVTWPSGTVRTLNNVATNQVLTVDDQVSATQLAFTTQPVGGNHGGLLATQPVVEVRDASGQRSLGYTGTVVLSAGAGGTLNGQASVAAVNGIATFSGLGFSGAGSRNLVASGTGLAAATSASFQVAKLPATITLSGLAVPFNGQPRPVGVSTDPPNLPVSVGYNGSSTAPAGPGVFTVSASIADPNYEGTANGTYTIAAPPVARLNASAVQGNPPFSVRFTDASTGAIDGWTLESFDSANQTSENRGGGLTATYNQPGTYEAVLTVRGPGGQSVARVRITVNKPPQLGPIGPPPPAAEDTPLVLNLAGKDPEPGGWAVRGADPALIARVAIQGDQLTFTPAANAFGADEVELVRTGASGLAVTQNVLLSWTPVDDPPVILLSLPNSFTAAEDQPLQVGGSAFAFDVDTPVGNLVWSAGGYDGKIVASALGGTGGVSLVPVANASGQTRAQLKLRDPVSGAEASREIALAWTPVPDPPQAPTAIYPPPGAVEVPLNPVLGWAAKDPDEEPLRYSLFLAPSGQAPAQVGGELGQPQYAAPTLRPSTTYAWKVVVRDQTGNTAEAGFTFTTQADRQAPTLSGLNVAVKEQSATLSWATDEPARGSVVVTPEAGGTALRVAGEVLQSSQALLVEGLKPGAWYGFEVNLSDEAGNRPPAVKGRFLTLAEKDNTPPRLAVSPFVEGLTDQSAVIRWSTDELATSTVEYREPGGTSTVQSSGALALDQQLRLSGLKPKTTYTFEVQSVDASQNPSLKASGTFTTAAVRDRVPPRFVENPGPLNVGDQDALIALKTDELCVAELRFDLDADLSDGRLSTSPAGTAHQFGLSGLSAGKKYYYQARIVDESGNEALSGQGSFQTRLAPDLRVAQILEGPSVEGISESGGVLVLRADKPVSAQVLLSTKPDLSGPRLVENRQLLARHSLALGGLQADTPYYYQLSVTDAGGRQAPPVAGSFRTALVKDEVPPRFVEGPFTEGIGADAATLAWRTDELATATVQVRAEPGGEGDRQVAQPTPASEQRLQLTQLQADTPYSLLVSIRDIAGNTARAQLSFRTRKTADIFAPRLLTGPGFEGLSATGVVIALGYDEPAGVTLRYAANAQLAGAEVLASGERRREHRLELRSLSAGTTYHGTVQASDGAGNTGQPREFSFTTQAQEDQSPPVFVDRPAALAVTETGARVEWTLDEPASGELEIGDGPGLTSSRRIGVSERRLRQAVELSGLQPNRVYGFRVRAVDAGGYAAVSESGTFTTLSQALGPPVFTSALGANPAQDQATLSWSTDQPTDAQVEYFRTSDPAEVLGESQGRLETSHTLTLTNLEPGAEYGYRVASRNGQGLSSERRQGTFRTRLTEDHRAPVILGSPTVASLETNRVRIYWRTDEFADSQVRLVDAQGGERREGQAEGVLEHNVDLTNLTPGQTYSYQVSSTDMQGNGPAQSEVQRFTTPAAQDESLPSFDRWPVVKTYTANSVLIAWATSKLTTATLDYGTTDAYELGSQSRLGSAVEHEWLLGSLSPGQTYQVRIGARSLTGRGPVYAPSLEVTTLASADQTPPAFTRGPIALYPTANTAVVEWSTDEASEGEVHFGAEAGTDVAVDTRFGTDHQLVLTNLLPSQTYTFTVLARDVAGNGPVQSRPEKFNTKTDGPVPTPKITEGPAALEVGTEGATVSWTTDLPTNTAVEYGPTAEYGNKKESGVLAQNHTVELKGLSPGTTYHFKVSSANLEGGRVSTDPAGNTLYSLDHQFTTQQQLDQKAPELLSGPVVEWTDQTAVLSWETDEMSNSRVDWVANSDRSKRDFRADGTMDRQHSITITGLAKRTAYSFQVTSVDAAGNAMIWGTLVEAAKAAPGHRSAKILQPPGGSGSFVTDNFADNQPPVIIDGPRVREKTTQSLTVEWKTDELADSFVRFGTSENLGDEVGQARDDQTHRITLTNLSPGRSYYFQVASTDPSGNGATESAVALAATAAEVDLSPPRFVEEPKVLSATDEQAVVAWRTDEPGSARVEYWIEGGEVLTRRTLDRLADQRVALTNLKPDTQYWVRVFVADGSQNEARAPVDLRLRTDRLPDLSPPQLRGEPVVSAVSDKGATIGWTTDEPANSSVDYDLTPYLGAVAGDPEFALQHRVVLTGLQAGRSYYFRVGSADAAGNGPVRSEVASFTTLSAVDTLAPAAPRGLALRSGARAMFASWNANREGDLAGYNLYRAENGDFALVASALTDTFYLDEGLSEGHSYRYQLRAQDRQGNLSGAGEGATGVPVLELPTPKVLGLEQGKTPGQPVLLIQAPEAAAAPLSYTALVSTREDFGDLVDRGGNLPEGVGGLARWRVNRNLDPDQGYWWRVRAFDGFFEGPWSAPVQLRPAEAETPSLSEDFDGDGVVGFGDFFLFADGFGGSDPTLDLDGDGVVGFGDFFLFADRFGQSLPTKPRWAQPAPLAAGTAIGVEALSVSPEEVVLRLRAEGIENLRGYGLVLEFDPPVLHFAAGDTATAGPHLRLVRQLGDRLLVAEHLPGRQEGLPAAQVLGTPLRLAVEPGRLPALRVRISEGTISTGRGRAWRVARNGEARIAPQVFSLLPNYPNPFNPATTLRVGVPTGAKGCLEVCNLLGQTLRVWDLASLGPGYHALVWDGLDDQGRPAATGVYLARLRAGTFSQTQKLLLLR